MVEGDVFRIQYAGGGGRGDPFEREPSKVLDDVRDGYISAETARDVYGVAVSGQPAEVDEAETRRLRSAPRNGGAGPGPA